MKPLLPLISFLIFFAVFVPRVLADSSLEVSDRSDFSRMVRDFGGGQTIFIRIDVDGAANLEGRLNLRDNGYNLANSFSLSRDGNYFATIIPAPYGSGYYSLEAVIAGKGTNITSVKTIKVGNATGVSVKVNVNNKVAGANSNNTGSSASAPSEQVKSVSSQDKEDVTGQSSSQDVLVETTDERSSKKSENFFGSIFGFCKKVFDAIWPF